MHVWLMAIRPRTLTAALSPVIMGGAMAYADKSFYLLAFLGALFGAVFIQAGTNLANDYFDHEKGADTAARLGPRRAMQQGLVSKKQMQRAIQLVFGCAALVGIYLGIRGGWPIWFIGISGIIFGVGYTYGRYALAYTGLADIFAFAYFGPLAVWGSYYVQTLRWDALPLVAGIAPGMLAVALLSINNLRDVDEDQSSNKRTLAVRFGRRFSKVEYIASLTLAGVMPFVLHQISGEHRSVVLASFVIVAAYPQMKFVWKNEDPRQLNHVLAGTGKLMILFAAIFCIGWLF